ncbi:hypothetical protein TRAPUB_1866 [Trametes pubescens]|uniref:Fungal-type protein kinase domain-containing protein n=1 Tax=Trametes pubescens TaxID=154538 RepID=A0A1M2VI64_TRAPU|nr:hypothetical protein TRAPUB_1866 [Trametes pubescens]
MSVETECLTRAAVRAQLIAYAHNTFLYQHRTALYSLLIIGREFRAARWDRSGVIVSRKVDYVEHIDEFVEFLWRFAQLEPAEQGLDPTAELMKEDAQAFKLMDYLARPDPSVDTEYMDTDKSETAPVPPAAESSAMTADVPDPAASGPSGDADDPSSDVLDDEPLPPQAAYNPNRVWAHRTRSSLKAAAVPEVAPPFPVEDSDAPPADNDPDLANIQECDDDPRVFRYVREKFRESLEPGWPRYKLRVGKEERVFLVGKPIFFSSSMFGRATRGYVAVDAKTRRFVFLKDSWRPFYAGVDPEGTYLKMFSNDPLLIVPAYLCDGDVGAQTAYTALYEGDPGRRIRDIRRRRVVQVKAADSAEGAGHKKRSREAGDLEESPQDIPAAAEPAPSETEDTLRHHIHYRIVVKDVCLPFDKFRSTRELVRLIYNCIATHYWAYTKYHLLHRDISCGNVLILPRHVMVNGKETVEWRGVLTDWELAKTVPKDGTDDKARQPERTGTWQFMSVASVASQWTLPVAIADELESFFHVMLFYGVRYLPNTLPSVPDFVIEYFDTFQQNELGRRFCSSIKEAAVASKQIIYTRKDLVFLKTTGQLGNPLNTLFNLLLDLFQARYQVIKHNDKLKEILEIQDAARPSSSAPPDETLEMYDWVEPWMVNCGPSPVTETDLPPLLEPPSSETVKKAAQLDTHKAVLQIFGFIERLGAHAWVDTNVVGKDQLAGYEPRPKFCMVVEAPTANRARGTSGAGSRASKRAKTESDTSVFDAVVVADKFESEPAVMTTGSKKGKGRA